MSNELIEQLSQARGIETKYIDAWGKDATVKEASKFQLLKALGYPIDDAAQLEQAVRDETEAVWQSTLNTVKVLRESEALEFEIRLPIELVNDTVSWQITTESGQQHSGQFVPVDQELLGVAHIGDTEYQEYIIALSVKLPLGYHTLSVSLRDTELAEQSLIIAPESCYMQPSIKAGDKTWGVSVQLYCLRSQSNWGVGDFSDLSYLCKQIASQGGGFVGLNPIHALYPSNPDSCSPYSPSSRRWLNYLYIDVTKVPGYNRSKKIEAYLQSENFNQKLKHARAVDFVDYKTVNEIKLNALKLAYEWFAANGEQSGLDAFIDEGGESLFEHALFDSIQDQNAVQNETSWGWPAWNEALQDVESQAVQIFAKQNKDLLRFYSFLQWQAGVQLENAQQVAIDAGMTIGIYRDLAVGVSSGSAETWANPKLYVRDANVGAPPDVLGPLGQDWGLPPMDPEELYQQGFQPIIDLFRSNMQSCGALRIDHVMALLRLWWVPAGNKATEGAYLYYPIDDLLALLALESQRNECLIIGEDLGTVPDGIRDSLQANGIYSYRVFFFEVAPDGGFFSPSHYPEQAMATLTTHDMPTLNGYWHCDDLNLGQEVGLYPDEAALQGLFESRHQSKQRILDSLHGHNVLPADFPRYTDQLPMSHLLNRALQCHMAAANSQLLSLQLEDWIEMDKPVNIPGTFNEYPNWRRKLSLDLQTIFARHDIEQLGQDLTRIRAQK